MQGFNLADGRICAVKSYTLTANVNEMAVEAELDATINVLAVCGIGDLDALGPPEDEDPTGESPVIPNTPPQHVWERLYEESGDPVQLGISTFRFGRKFKNHIVTMTYSASGRASKEQTWTDAELSGFAAKLQRQHQVELSFKVRVKVDPQQCAWLASAAKQITSYITTKDAQADFLDGVEG